MDSLLLIRDVHKTFRSGETSVRALDGISFAVKGGELVVLRGPSGSGKSTLLNVLCGWEAVDSGSLTWSAGERPPVAVNALPWDQLGIVPQTLGLLEELTMQENVALPSRFLPSGPAGPAGPGGPAGPNTSWALDQLGLSSLATRTPAETSLGEQQRASVARAVVLNPAVILADEPTAHQDAHWVDVLFRLLRAAADDGASCLVATHSSEGLAYADRVLEMRDGRLSAGSAA